MKGIPEAGFLRAKGLGRTLEKCVDGAGRLLNDICVPVAEEIGFFQDKVRHWRSCNATVIANDAAETIGGIVPEEAQSGSSVVGLADSRDGVVCRGSKCPNSLGGPVGIIVRW
jgi:hypothetical protein